MPLEIRFHEWVRRIGFRELSLYLDARRATVLCGLLGLFIAGCQTPVVVHELPAKSGDPGRLLELARASWWSAAQGREASAQTACREYNQAVLTLLRSWPTNRHGVYIPREFSQGSRRIAIPVHWAATDYPPDYFDRVLVAEALRFKGIRHYEPVGWGQPLVAVATNHGFAPEETFFPPEGIVRSLTALLEFPDPTFTNQAPRLVIYQPDRQATVTVAGTPRELSADYSAAYGVLLARTKLKGAGVRAFLNRKSLGREAGIFLMEPFRPDKIPVLMIHGLASSPLAWEDLTDALWAHPLLRSHYQVWHYFYPTTFPYLHSAAELRDNLDELRAYFDPEGKSVALRRMVIVAHSMGGLMARRLVTESRDVLWNHAFSRPLDELVCAPTERATLRRYFFFHPEPGITRVIFLATPHRGSDLAAGVVGRVGRTLADHDPDFDRFFSEIARRNPGGLTPRMQKWSKARRLTSVQVLSSENPVLRAMAELPFSPGVKVNSILGDRGKKLGDESCDGIVSYRSAHLAEAESELTVPSGHAVNRDPGAIAEVLRILRVHWQETASEMESASR